MVLRCGNNSQEAFPQLDKWNAICSSNATLAAIIAAAAADQKNDKNHIIIMAVVGGWKNVDTQSFISFFH
jgi:hypothetical protein